MSTHTYVDKACPSALERLQEAALAGSSAAAVAAGRTSRAVGWPASRLAVTRWRPIIPVPPITRILVVLVLLLLISAAMSLMTLCFAGIAGFNSTITSIYI
jgi:hypothetical protein